MASAMGKQSKNKFVCAGIERGLPLIPMAEAMGSYALRWIPACAGMTGVRDEDGSRPAPG
jgi:hypothetical protein